MRSKVTLNESGKERTIESSIEFVMKIIIPMWQMFQKHSQNLVGKRMQISSGGCKGSQGQGFK